MLVTFGQNCHQHFKLVANLFRLQLLELNNRRQHGAERDIKLMLQGCDLIGHRWRASDWMKIKETHAVCLSELPLIGPMALVRRGSARF